MIYNWQQHSEGTSIGARQNRPMAVMEQDDACQTSKMRLFSFPPVLQRCVQVRTSQRHDLLAFDPQLTIAGKRMQFIMKDSSFKGSHFKFLGRWLCADLDESSVKTHFLHKYQELLSIVENAPLDGFMKLWIYQHFMLGMLSSPLLIQDFNRDFVKTQITRPCGVYPL